MTLTRQKAARLLSLINSNSQVRESLKIKLAIALGASVLRQNPKADLPALVEVNKEEIEADEQTMAELDDIFENRGLNTSPISDDDFEALANGD
jgi:hypothetical protein